MIVINYLIKDNLLNRKVSLKEYNEIQNYIYKIGLENGYIQDLEDCEEGYVPNFNFENV